MDIDTTLLPPTPQIDGRLPAEEHELLVALDDARVAAATLAARAGAALDESADARDQADLWDEAHAFDQFDVDRHDAEALKTSAQRRMEAIHAAYERLADGRFGWCEACDGLIPQERLRAVPETRWCVACASYAGAPAAGARVAVPVPAS